MRTRAWSFRAGSLVLLLVTWEVWARRSGSLFVAGAGETATALGELLVSRELWSAIWVSNQAMVLGFSLAAIVGVPLGFLMGRWRWAERVLDPYLSILLVTPMAAVIPIVIMALGLGLASRVVVVFAFTFVTVVVNARAGLKMVEPAWVEMARAFGAGERELWLKVLLRGSMPAIVMGLRLGLIRAVSGMITLELLLVAVGLGKLMLDFQSDLNAASLQAMVLVVVGEAVILTQLLRRLESRSSMLVGPVAGE